MAGREWLNPAGGLRYHARALFGARAWEPFRASLGSWLSRFETPHSARAVLVGPSAGYCIPDDFLRRFERLTVLEPDPIAGILLTRRLRRLGVDLRLERRDQLIAPLLDGGPGLAELLAAEPAQCVIFGNVLGQTRFLVGEPDFERFKSEFRRRIRPLLQGRAWLSFHDRLSGSLAPQFSSPFDAARRLDDAAVLRELYRAESGELFDHGSEGFFSSSLPHTYLVWRIDRSRYHLIEGVASQP